MGAGGGGWNRDVGAHRFTGRLLARWDEVVVPMNNTVRLPKDFNVVVLSAKPFKGTWLQRVGHHLALVLLQEGLEGFLTGIKPTWPGKWDRGLEDRLRGPHGGGEHGTPAACGVAPLL